MKSRPDDQEVRALRDLWLSRLMFNQFVGWAPETRSFEQFLDDHTAAFTPRMDGWKSEGPDQK